MTRVAFFQLAEGNSAGAHTVVILPPFDHRNHVGRKILDEFFPPNVLGLDGHALFEDVACRRLTIDDVHEGFDVVSEIDVESPGFVELQTDEPH